MQDSQESTAKAGLYTADNITARSLKSFLCYESFSAETRKLVIDIP